MLLILISRPGFFPGTTWLGYSHSAWLGVAMVLVGCAWLVLLERRIAPVTASAGRH